MPHIQFVLLISRDDRPLYIQAFDNASEGPASANRFLKYNFLSHMALDVFSSPSLLSFREQQQAAEDTGGVLLLFIQDDVSVHGFETNNGLKIVVGLEVGALRALKDLFLLLHKCYLKAICNPFSSLQTEGEGSLLQSQSFDRGIRAIVERWNKGDN